ncbi:MAG: hydantoinase B/oxoprolinase family protein [Proteobacteria bacterium]|nr:hydantoinase B/oxoprolinase family protein [Pseudomonadota bacterium]
MSAPAVDPITVEVVGNRFQAGTAEMLATLVKTAFSPNIKERRDCSVAIFDAGGRLLALGESSPMHLGSLLGLVENITRRFPADSFRPGDVFLTNDPYVGGGSHLPDLTLASPVFAAGRLVAFAASLAHHSDVGGRVAGSESADCTSIFQEGLRIPPVRLMKAGVLKTDILDIVLLNSRTPREREGDLKAQLAANAVGARRIQETFARFGTERTLAAIEAHLAHAEARARAGIARLSDGTYENEDVLDHDGLGECAARLRVAVTIAGEDLRLDFTGTDPQVGGARNLVRVATLAGVYQAVKAIVDPTLPPNAGFFRAVRVTTPPGSLVDCRPPAAVGDRSPTVNILGDLIHGAFAKAAPERVMAGCGPRQGIIFSGVDPRRRTYFVDYEIFAGASGARREQDGHDVVRVHSTVADNTPAEASEQEFPLAVERCEMIPDSGGPGRFRGGLALRCDVRVLAEEGRISGRAARHARAAPGLFGGAPGRRCRFVLRPGEGRERVLPGVFSELKMAPGTVIRVETPSGAGFGDSFAREPGRVLADVLAGKVSVAAAKQDYGVVVAGGRIDEAATRALRADSGARATSPEGGG